MTERPRVYLFWDNSNIFIPAKYVANRREGGFAEQNIRIHFENLHRLALGGRPQSGGVCVGSVPPELEKVWEHLRKTGVAVELYERGADSGKEQGVDQCLQVHMLRAGYDHKPGVAVLLTGDGKGYDDGVGFHADLERLAAKGWGIEVLSWEAACRKSLKSWAQANGAYVPLDDFYEAVTFVQGGRSVKPLSMTRRQHAAPKMNT